jgi:hypothetical protein
MGDLSKMRKSMIYQRIQRAFVSLCFNSGLSVAKMADSRAVRELIAKLHPVSTEHPLIRAGSEGDGGYLIPDDLAGIEACFSPGVDNRATFESDLVARGIPCYLADASVDEAPISNSMVHFTKKFLGVTNSDLTITLDEWVNHNCPGDADLILQMDIEGAEWPVLLNVTSNTLRRFRIIVVELHDLDRLMDKQLFTIMRAALERITDDFFVVHNHPNNFAGSVRYRSLIIPRAIEITFLRRDRAAAADFARQFPHPLDRKNNREGVDLPLPRDWYH